MAPDDLTSRRLCAQGITCPLGTPHDAVARLTAVQAQDRPSALWAIGLRTTGGRAEDVEKAVGSRSIVRTWLMRGTLHFAAAEDIRWVLDLVAPRVLAGSRTRDEQLRLDEGTYERSRAAFADALGDQGCLTRSEMMRVLEEAGISTAGQRGYHILWHLALEKLICFGPMVGREQSFVLLDGWVPPGKAMPREQALGELARRYFTGHGPAGVQDLAWWSGLTISEVRKGIEVARPHLVEEAHDGVPYFSGDGAWRDGDDHAHLLPAYDEYIIGYKDRGAVLDKDHTKDVLSSNGVFYPTIVTGGRVGGKWRVVNKRSVSIEARPFARLSAPEIEMLGKTAERYGEFRGLPVMLSVRDAPHAL